MLRLRCEFDSRLGRCCGVGQRTYLSRALTANGGPCPPAWRARVPWCHMGVGALPVTEQRVVSAGSAPGGTRTPAGCSEGTANVVSMVPDVHFLGPMTRYQPGQTGAVTTNGRPGVSSWAPAGVVSGQEGKGRPARAMS